MSKGASFKTCLRRAGPPGRGDFSFGDFSHALSPKNLSKNGFCPRKGVAFLRKALLQKNFQGVLIKDSPCRSGRGIELSSGYQNATSPAN